MQNLHFLPCWHVIANKLLCYLFNILHCWQNPFWCGNNMKGLHWEINWGINSLPALLRLLLCLRLRHGDQWSWLTILVSMVTITPIWIQLQLCDCSAALWEWLWWWWCSGWRWRWGWRWGWWWWSWGRLHRCESSCHGPSARPPCRFVVSLPVAA